MINLKLIGLFILAAVLMPLATAMVLTWLGNYTQQILTNDYGTYSQIGIGGLGTIVHELSHLCVAILFAHQITGFKLLRLHNLADYDNLGYVKYRWGSNNWLVNWYESLGNFFIGLAPCYVCSIILWAIHGYFFGNQTMVYSINADNIQNALKVAFSNIIHPFGSFSWQLIVYLILVIMIACTGYGLSHADMRGAVGGLPYWIALIVVLYFVTIWTGQGALVSSWLWDLIVLWLTFAGRGLIYILIALLLISGIKKVF